RQSTAVHSLVEQQRKEELQAGHARRRREDRPDVLMVTAPSDVVGCDEVDAARPQQIPQSLDLLARAKRRIDLGSGALASQLLRVEEQVVKTGLGGGIDSVPASTLDQRERPVRGRVNDVNPRLRWPARIRAPDRWPRSPRPVGGCRRVRPDPYG